MRHAVYNNGIPKDYEKCKGVGKTGSPGASVFGESRRRRNERESLQEKEFQVSTHSLSIESKLESKTHKGHSIFVCLLREP